MTSQDRVDRIRAEWRRERPELDSSPQEVIGRLHRLARRLTEELVLVYAEYGLTEGEFDLLCTLRRAGPAGSRQPADLARTTMITTGGLSKRIDRLEAAGLVARAPADGPDRRAKVVRLTEPGLALIDDAFTAHMANEARLLANMPADDRQVLTRILRDWLLRLDDD